MSNRQLEEQAEQHQNMAVAVALGISADDLDRLEWRIEDEISDDGALYGHNVYFEEGPDPGVLAKLSNRLTGAFIRIGPL